MLRDWGHRCNDGGIAALRNRTSTGRPRRLTMEHQRDFATLAEQGPDLARDGVLRWSCAELKAQIEQRFGLQYHERSVGKLLAHSEMRRLSPRPAHHQTAPKGRDGI